MVPISQQGFYRDPPNRRMAYDEDGSLVVYLETNGDITQTSGAQRIALNDEDSIQTHNNGLFGVVGPYIVMIFPELRDISHSYRNLDPSGGRTSMGFNYEVSANTTNGLDGTWTTSAPFTAWAESTSPNFRGDNLTIVGSSGSKGIKHHMGNGATYSAASWRQWHIYGVKSAGQTPHRIDFCDSGGNELLIDFDYGDQPRSSDRTWGPSTTYNQSSALYLKNRSSTKQATEVNVTFEVLATDFNNFLGLSKDNITFGTTINYTTINPQQVVGPIYVKHSPTIAAALGVKAARLQVAVGTWL